MDTNILNLLVAGADVASAPPAWVQFLPLAAMGVIFWFLILRPQMKRQKEHRTRIDALKKGDQVLTGGGLLGKVLRVDDDYADVEIAANIKVKVLKSTISDVLSANKGKAAND